MKKRKAKERAVRRDVEEPCLYCGRPTLYRDYIINPGAPHELPSCSGECFEKTRLFVDYDKRYRTLFYTVLLVLVAANLLLLGYDVTARWKYLPMLGMSSAALVCPLVFTRYERYQTLGIRKTKTVIRSVAAVLAAFSIALIIGC